MLMRQCGGHVVRRLMRRSYSQASSSGVPYKTLQDGQAGEPSTVPSAADVVIIGGGSLGCNTLYHLTKLGITNAVLLEKDQLTAGTTWHTAGLVWNLRPTDTEVEMLKYAVKLMSDLEAETDISTGWIQNGGLFIANNKERLNEYKRLSTVGRVYGITSHVLSPEETKKLYPLMNVEDVYGTLYSPADGTIDPAGICTALSRAATKAGAQVITKAQVTGISTKDDDFGVRRVTGVQTSNGFIKTNCVVNCAGAWAPKLGAMAGVKVPLIAMHHAYVVTERIEGIQNMPNVRDHDASVYLKLQGDALSVGGYEPHPIFCDEVKDDFAFSLYDLDWDVFSVHIEGAVNRVPAIGETGVKSTVCGPESFTADHKPLMGESPEVRGFFLGCGFNSSGMMMGPGCGRELAKWIVNGRPDLDLFGYDISFPKHHDVIETECMTCRSAGAVFDMSYFGKFYLTGPDSQKAVDWIFSNDIRKPPGSTVYTCMLNKAGGVEGDLTVSVVEPGSGSACDPSFEGAGYYIAAGGAAGQHTWSHLSTVVQDQGFDCQITNHSEDMCMISVQGLRSRDILQPLCDVDLSNENFPFSTHKLVNIGKIKLRAMRVSFVGEMGWELHVPNEGAVGVYQAVMEQAKKYGVCNAGYRAIDSLSIEKGYRHWHADLRADDSPLEAGLAFTCKLKSDIPFLGREAIEKQKKEGLKKRIACFTIDEHVPLLGLEAIWRNGDIVGHVRRGEFAFFVGKSMAYGYVQHPEGGTVTPAFLKSGEYELESMGTRYKATLHSKSPFDPSNLRVKGMYDALKAPL
ncbi:PREDICTED: sarcosine dehydrogenase, mitochondrial-like [Priapulus caudatus]|uniref:Sarcosine dehydrogenase, mitochondrial-like n=1 Tax=Priapulus caudatus TaxID=37621 RepID=A0ABM1DY99_PRICU|nr:PREDICTED: sarcosine dehydrogenase, mitochondrial-like [Priapulus caudatus]